MCPLANSMLREKFHAPAVEFHRVRLLLRPRSTPHEIDEIERVGRLRVGTPSDMLVRAHQHELVAIELRRLTRSDVENGKRKAALRSRRHDAGDMRRGVEAQ